MLNRAGQMIARLAAKLYLHWHLTEFHGYPDDVKLTHLETRQAHGEPQYIFEVEDGRQAIVYSWVENGEYCYRAFWHTEEQQ